MKECQNPILAFFLEHPVYKNRKNIDSGAIFVPVERGNTVLPDTFETAFPHDTGMKFPSSNRWIVVKLANKAFHSPPGG